MLSHEPVFFHAIPPGMRIAMLAKSAKKIQAEAKCTREDMLVEFSWSLRPKGDRKSSLATVTIRDLYLCPVSNDDNEGDGKRTQPQSLQLFEGLYLSAQVFPPFVRHWMPSQPVATGARACGGCI